MLEESQSGNAARADAIVLGAGIVGTSVALHLAKRGLRTVLIDRRGPGEETSYGNAGIVEGNTIFPHTFPGDLSALMRVAFKRASGTNYHLGFLPRVAPWLLAFRRASRPERLLDTARTMRPLFARAVAEHETLLAESGASHYLRKTGWLKLFRSDGGFASTATERGVARDWGIAHRVLDVDEARALEPNLMPVFRHALHWTGAASLSNPLAVTRAFATRFQALGGRVLQADARTLERVAGEWQVGGVRAPQIVVALGPWSLDLLKPLGLTFPLAIKRGYHMHYRLQGNATLQRPVVDVENGYCVAPMEQGFRITTGAEFAARDAAPTPVQLDRLMPAAKQLFLLGEKIDAQPWMGRRPCFADSRPIIGRAPGQSGLWLAFGHGHSGLTLGPVTGRLLGEMIAGETPFCDPVPYGPERFAA
jgi:D-amino-acid dehydrogenase